MGEKGWQPSFQGKMEAAAFAERKLNPTVDRLYCGFRIAERGI
jgi:hypothetical protein